MAHRTYGDEKVDIESEPASVPPLVDVPIEEKANVLPPPAPPPDGGLRAWLQVLGCYLVFFNVWYSVQASWPLKTHF
jgi:hypothetical protein